MMFRDVVIYVILQDVLLIVAVGVENIARGADTVSTEVNNPGRGPDRAVDGSRNTNSLATPHCTHTIQTTNPWWRVDLGSLSEVQSVSILNRGDCCSERLRNFTIQMSQSLAEDQVSLRDPSLCFHYHPGLVAAGATVSFACPAPVYVRYVKIQLHLEPGILTLCEVEVFGSRPAPPRQCPHYTVMKAVPGRKSPAMTLKTITVPAKIHCAIKCSQTNRCYSLNIKQDGHAWICELLEDVREYSGNDIIAGSGWTYFRVGL